MLTTPAAASSASTWQLWVHFFADGTGRIVSSPAGIDCRWDEPHSACYATFPQGVQVKLTFLPGPDSFLEKVIGGGPSTTNGDCDATLVRNPDGTATCTARLPPDLFATSVDAFFRFKSYPLTVATAGSGSGVVRADLAGSGAGIECGTRCSDTYAFGTVVRLTATPAAGSVFAGWSGDCTGTGVCAVKVDAAHSVTATFAAAPTPPAPPPPPPPSPRPPAPPPPPPPSPSPPPPAAPPATPPPPPATQPSTQCVVPRVIGKRLAAARTALRKADCAPGRVTTVRSRRAKGRVVGQSPRPSTRLRQGARVNLRVSRGR